MSSQILVSAQQLHEMIRDGTCLVVDCRFDLSDAGKGRADWLAAHLPGAHYAHLDDDLAAPPGEETGRHPLPEPGVFAQFLSSLGWSPPQLVVAYDEGSNAIAGRLWWLMRYFGQPAALLDGGIAAWTAAGLPLESGPVEAPPGPPARLAGNDRLTVSSGQIEAATRSGELLVLDARAPERFSGQLEPLDANGGHIPGAVNRHLQLNLGEDGRFKEPGVLRAEFEALLGEMKPAQVAHSCGSGVTACHNLFAMELAGLGPSLLYPGSWSEWITAPSRPIETGG